MKTTRSIGALVLLFVAACGGNQTAEVEVQEVVETPCCFPDRWESPPPNIGDTPNDAPAAPDDALEPFQPPGTPPGESEE